MRLYRAPTVLIACVTAAGLLAACSLNPKEDPTRYYVLTAVSEDPGLYEAAGMVGATIEEAAESAGPEVDFSVGVGPITIPAYLKRSRIVSREATNELRFHETERWGEPLQEAIQYTLAENIVVILGTSRTVLHPWYVTEAPDYSVSVDVVRFERDANGVVVLVAQVEIRDMEGQILAVLPLLQDRPARDDSMAASVYAQSALIAQLSRRIADEIRRVTS